MIVKIVLVLAILAQLTAAFLALRLNQRYRSHAAWTLISGATAGLSILEIAVLVIVWDLQLEVFDRFPVWTASLSALLVSILFVVGVSMIEPMFIKISKAESWMQQENQRLSNNSSKVWSVSNTYIVETPSGAIVMTSAVASGLL